MMQIKNNRTRALLLICNIILSVMSINYIIYSVDAQSPTCTGPNCPPTSPQTGTTTHSTTTGVGGVLSPTQTTTTSPVPVHGGSGGANPTSQPPVPPGISPGDSGTPTVDGPPGTTTTNPPSGTGTGGGGPGKPPGGGWDLNLQNIVTKAGLGATVFGTIGTLAGGDNGALWGSVSGAIGGVVAGIAESAGATATWSVLLGLGVATIIFLLTYHKKSIELVEFHCLPWQAPIGGENCKLCNDYNECSEYTCKSLGQACEIVNPGTTEQKCVWKNPHDVNSPTIQMTKVNKGHRFTPDNSVRPPATGVKISLDNGACLKPFTPLEFSFVTNEPSQCKIGYNLTSDIKNAFEEMEFYVGGNSYLLTNHTQIMALPGPEALNSIAPQLNNNGAYTLFVRCRDANGNFNQDPFSVSFCVDKGPDTTPPIIVSVNIPSGKPIQFNRSSLELEVYVNEPSECSWSREDLTYEKMQNKMNCDPHVWVVNNNNVYTCKTTITGIESRKENLYYFRCKDKPWQPEGDRNVNSQSYLYRVIGTQPLNILKILPHKETIKGATETIPINLEVVTDNGYDNGKAICYYYWKEPQKEEDYLEFLETGTNRHRQRQDLVSGNYVYYIKCIDLGGNTVYNTTTFNVYSDKIEPAIIRAYKESSSLKIITDEESTCSYSISNCNFEIDSGTTFTTYNDLIHSSEWVSGRTYYIRCKDRYNNQPNPNTCSIIIRPINLEEKEKTNTKSDWTVQFR